MVFYKAAETVEELEGILRLQKANLPAAISKEELITQGFVTVDHSYAQLSALNNIEKHVIGVDNDRVIAYTLAMTIQSAKDIPVLVPMFNMFENLRYKNQPLLHNNIIVVGQVCVDKAFRSKGVFDGCYEAYKQRYLNKYDLAITEIDKTNTRSLNAHERIGFEIIHSYTSESNTEWMIVAWNWRKK